MDSLQQKFKKIPSAVKVVIIVLVAFYAFDGLVGNGFNYPAVVIESALTSDKLISEFTCDNQYAWRVVESDRALKGNKFELGTSAEVQTWRDLLLVSKGYVVTNMNPNYVYSWNYFPTGSTFSKAYIFREQDFYLENEQDTLNQLVLTADLSSLSREDFETVSHCLQENKPNIESQLSVTDKKFKPVGWLTYGDAQLYESSSEASRKTFLCENGAELVTKGPYVAYSTSKESISKRWHLRMMNDTIGTIGFDGTLVQGKYIEGIDMSQPEIPVSRFNCQDEAGMTFEQFLNSVPERITFLP